MRRSHITSSTPSEPFVKSPTPSDLFSVSIRYSLTPPTQKYPNAQPRVSNVGKDPPLQAPRGRRVLEELRAACAAQHLSPSYDITTEHHRDRFKIFVSTELLRWLQPDVSRPGSMNVNFQDSGRVRVPRNRGGASPI